MRDSNTESKDTGVVGIVGFAITFCSIAWGISQHENLEFQKFINDNQEREIQVLTRQLIEAEGKLSGYRENRR